MVTTVNTANKDIDYIVKDFNSSVDALINFATVNFGPGTSANRLWTNFNVDSFSRNWLEIVAFMADVFFFYFDNQATQTYLQTATIRSAVLDIAKQFGFTPATATSSSGTVQLTVNGNGTISRGFRMRASNGTPFFLTNDVTNASGPGTVNGSVLQGIIRTEQFTAEGIQNEVFVLQGPNVIRDLTNINPADVSPQITVAGNDYTLVTSFIRHNGEDSAAITDSLGNVIGGGGRVYTLGENDNGEPTITFGDGVFGRKLAPGELVTITYRTGGGSAGNIGAETLTTLVDTNPIVTSVVNNNAFSGGADQQSIEQLRELIPASLRTLDRAVAEQDYSDILVANFSEVFAASQAPNNSDPGVDLDIFVVPQGLGITAITSNAILKTNLESFLDRRKTVTVQFQILDAFGIDTLIGLEIFLEDTASRSTISNAVNTALTDFFNLTTGGIDESGIGFAEEILIRDICKILDGIAGIDRYEIQQLSYRPRIAEEIVGLVTTYNSSSVTIFPNVSEREWLVGAAGQVTRDEDEVLFSNEDLTAFTYDDSTGELAYAFPVDLTEVASGDKFRSGPGEEEETDILMPDFASVSDGQYFTLNAANNLTRYAFYLDTTGGNATIPTVPGHTLVQVDVSAAITDVDMATAMATEINAQVDFLADNSGGTSNTINVQNVAVGETDDAANNDIGGAFSITVTQQGTNANVDITILAVDVENSKLFLSEGLLVSTTVVDSTHGSVLSGPTTFESFKVFKKILATTTNLSSDSITDSNLDLSVKRGTGAAIEPRVLLDNTNVFIKNEFATGGFYLVDSQDNIWEIESNDSNTLKTSITAVNDAAITNVASGSYKIVQKLVGKQVLFAGNIFNINYNTEKTIVAIGAQFSQIGTIGDTFYINFEQSNIGNLGVNLDLISFDDSTGTITLNSAPELQGINANNILIDSDGQIFNIIGVDNRAKPSVEYIDANRDDEFILEGSGLGSQIAQGFQVTEADTYAVVSLSLKREGNAIGNLTARIVNDSGGLPDLSSVVAISESINVTDISDTSFEKVLFSFEVPPTLAPATQYHIVINADASYSATETSNQTVFDNTGLVGFTYNVVSGEVAYDSAVDLSDVVAGNYFKDGAGNLFSVLAVDDTNDTLILEDSLVVDNTVNSSDDGSIIVNDRILVGLDSSAPAYADGEFSRFDGALWSNSTLGPSPSGTDQDCIFSVEGTKTITVDSNLTPTLGPGATVTRRYYDDLNEISFALGLSNGVITSATDVNAFGKGTVATVPDRDVDRFVFRTSRYADDIVNLRPEEIPQINTDNITLNIFGGVE